MKSINISSNIAKLRSQKRVTQEQMASAIGVSAQAVSKWEKGICMPDTATVALIASYFNVSIDHLFFGDNFAYDDIYAQSFKKVSEGSHYGKESFDAAHRLFASAHYGIAKGSLGNYDELIDEPSHIGNENGVSLLGGNGFGAIVLRDYYRSVDKKTIDFASKYMKILGEEYCLITLAAVISMSEISFGELLEKTGLENAEQQKAIDTLTHNGILTEKDSKHKSLGKTYTVKPIYHTCLCILMATMGMQYRSFRRISCCMGYGDYPLSLDDKKED